MNENSTNYIKQMDGRCVRYKDFDGNWVTLPTKEPIEIKFDKPFTPAHVNIELVEDPTSYSRTYKVSVPLRWYMTLTKDQQEQVDADLKRYAEKMKQIAMRQSVNSHKQEERNMLTDILNILRNLNLDRRDTEELIALLAFSTQLKNSYADMGLIAPSYVDESVITLKREIADRRRDELLREQKMLDQQERSLLSREEKREQIEQRKAEIAGLLGTTTAPVTK